MARNWKAAKPPAPRSKTSAKQRKSSARPERLLAFGRNSGGGRRFQSGGAVDTPMHPGTQIRVRASARLTIATCVLGLLVAFGLLIGDQAKAAVEGRPRPSFVVIQTDDQTLDQLYAAIAPGGGVPVEAMPYTHALIAERGVTFNRYYTPYSLCAPSRTSLLTGRFAHNNDVRGNVSPER